MNKLKLLSPAAEYAEQVMAYKEEILQNGGVLENEITDTVGLSRSSIIQRYWISL